MGVVANGSDVELQLGGTFVDWKSPVSCVQFSGRVKYLEGRPPDTLKAVGNSRVAGSYFNDQSGRRMQILQQFEVVERHMFEHGVFKVRTHLLHSDNARPWFSAHFPVPLNAVT